MTPSSSRPPERSTLVELFARLDRAAFGRFVADLWRLRGHEARFDGDVVRVSDARGDGDRVVVPFHGDRGTDGRPLARVAPCVDPDTVVAVVASAPDDPAAAAAAEESSADLLGPADLRRMVLYAIDRESCDALFRRHFGRGLDDIGRARGGSDRGLGEWVRGAGPTASVGVPVAALLVAVLVAAGIGGSAMHGPAGPSSPGGSAVATPDRQVATPVTLDRRPSATPDAPVAPGCYPTPRASVEAQLAALRTNDPETDDGIRRVWNGATAEFRRYTGPFETFVTILHNHPFVHLLDPRAVEYGTLTRSGGVARQTFTVTSPDDERYVYTFTLVRRGGPSDRGCWSLTGLTYRTSPGARTPGETETRDARSATAGTSPPVSPSTRAATLAGLTNV